jgi:hypothetical protein
MRNKKDTNDTESIYNFHEESTADQAMAIDESCLPGTDYLQMRSLMEQK